MYCPKCGKELNGNTCECGYIMPGTNAAGGKKPNGKVIVIAVAAVVLAVGGIIGLAVSRSGADKDGSDKKPETAVTTVQTEAQPTAETTVTTTETTTKPAETTTVTTTVPEPKTGFDEATNIEVKNGGLIYHIPDYYENKSEGDSVSLKYQYAQENKTTAAVLMTYMQDELFNDGISDEEENFIYSTLEEQMKITGLEVDFVSTDKKLGRKVHEKKYSYQDKEKSAAVYIALLENKEYGMVNILLCMEAVTDIDEPTDYDYFADFDSIYDSIEEDKDHEYAEPEIETEDTFEHNKYYDVEETAQFKNSIGYTILVYKVLAKQNVSVSSTMLAYDASGSVIGKSTDDIVLTEGKYNYFRYSFESDISSAKLEPGFTAKKDSYLVGERNAVEMVSYNQSGDDLYITLKQTGDKLGSFSKFKLLFYKGDNIVDTEDGYFNIYAQNLNGKGSQDVASIWVYGTDFDRIEYIYEP